MKKLMCFLLSSLLVAPVWGATDNSGSLILSFAGVASDSIEEARQDSSDNKSVNYGAGILIEAGINDRFGIETGVLYVDKEYQIKESSEVQLVQSVKRLHIPALARFWMTDYFSIAAGPFLGLKVGDTETSLRVGDSELGSLKTSADDDLEYGLEAAATFNLAVNDKTGIFLEARYSKALNEDSSEETEKVSALTGLKIDL